jgi:AAA+ ATPase superfamily predicted ATPase
VAVGVAGGVAFGVAGGVAFGVAVGVAVGVAGGVAGGVAFGVSFIAFYFRLPFYLIELPWQLVVGFFAETAPPERANRLFRLSPIYYDELIWLPLFGLDGDLIEIGKKDRQTAQQLIIDVAQSFRQDWAATNALIELTAYDVERAQDARAIANIAEQFAWLPPTMPGDLENVLPPLREIAQYAQAALESDTLYNQQTQLRNAIAQTQRVREGLVLSSNRQMAARFGRALETWEQVLGKELRGLDAREIIPNVYVAGSPLATASKVFKGRRDLFLALERELATAAETRPTLLLFGARRCGKTSAIRQMPVCLGPGVIPVEVNLQEAKTAEGVKGLLVNIADQIKANALKHRRVQLSALSVDELRNDPYLVFQKWLNRVEEQVGTRWILLNLDEYEKLIEMMEAGRLDERVLDVLRNIIQHHPRVTVLLSGSHTLEDLPPIWSNYLINVRVLKIENLKVDEARELIVQPIENFPLEYEPAAVERIIAVTGCQPFLLQATGRDLVNMLNEQNRTRATLADADRALDSVLTTGVAYFQDLWGNPRDSDDAQRAVMRAVATQKDFQSLEDFGSLNAALRKLVHRDILAVAEGGVIASPAGAKQSPTSDMEIASRRLAMTQGYRFRVELVRQWVERNAA